MAIEAKRQELTPAEKLQERFRKWKFPEGVEFARPDLQQAYQRRVQMFIDVISLRKPERIPVCPMVGYYPFSYAGVTAEEAMYDHQKLAYALEKYHIDFTSDALTTAILSGPGEVLEMLDYRLYRWPGHGVSSTTPYQCVEDQYMRADEYPLLINDPTDFFLRTYLPRVFGALEPWRMLGPLTDILELPMVCPSLIPFGLPPVREAMKKLLDAGQAALAWAEACIRIDQSTVTNHGVPGIFGGFTKAPFDTLGDTLRGTRSMMLDKFRQPQAVLAAMDRLVPLAIDLGVRAANRSQIPAVVLPLHKGADSFMSAQDFRTFYWPTLKAVILGLVKEGVVPCLFAEGSYNQRLDIVADRDIPDGTTMWLFDQTDLREVKQRFAGWACFGGNVPSSLLVAATPGEVKAHVKRLLDDVGRDGGYFLATGAVIDDAKAENLHAMIDAGREYGVSRI
jgi:uroporphyrinogen-III decarboxylase